MAKFPHLEVRLLGGFSVRVDGQLHTSINQPQQQSLLAYLMLQTERPQLRRQIAFCFWPDSPETRAFANLRRALHKLRNDCPALTPYLLSTNTTLSWQRPPSFSLDVLAYERLAAEASEATEAAPKRQVLEQAIDCYRGELLPGCYDEWLLPERERLNQSYLYLLQQLVELLAETGDYETAIQYAAQLRISDPFREQTYRQLMTLYEGLGDRAASLRIYHDCVDMLERELGVEPGPETHAIYQRLLNRSTLLEPAGALPTSRYTVNAKLVGRQEEWQRLQAAWQQASQGQPQFVLIQGEAGIGKTHLAEALLTWARQHDQLTVQTRAYAAEGQLTYSPVIDWLRSPPYDSLLTSLDDVWLTECIRLLPELLAARPDLSVPTPLSDNWQRQRLFEGLARAVLAPQQPLLVLLDDLQWADKETLEWLHFLLRFDLTVSLLLVGTVRMSEVTAAHPLTTLMQQLHRDGRIREIHLAALPAAASDELARQIAGDDLTSETLAALRHYAEGVPLFLVEAVRAEIDKAAADRWQWSVGSDSASPNTLPLPPKVYAVIQARLNQLSPQARQTANVAAVVGRACSAELLALAGQEEDETLVQSLDELWRRRIVREQGANYDLSHDRIRDVTYAEISPMQRKRLHRQVAEALTQRYRANLEAVSAQLAYHYEAAGLMPQAIASYLQAGKEAQQIYANHRAAELSRRGLALIEHLPVSMERDQQELDLYLVLITAVRVMEGWTSTQMYQIVNQALHLSYKIDDPTPRFHLGKALFSYHVVGGDVDQGQPFAEQLLTIAKQEQMPLFLVIAYNNLAGVNFHRGIFKVANELFEKSLTYYTPQQHQEHVFFDGADYGILSLSWQSHNLWCLGYPDQALNHCQKGVNLSQEFVHPASQAMALAYLGLLYHLRQEVEVVKQYAERCLSLARQHTIGYYREWAGMLYTWSLAFPNPTPDKIADLRAALNDFRSIGGGLRWSYYLSLLAQLYERAEETQRGLEIIDQALVVAERTQGYWWNAELYRLRGNLLLQGQANSHDLAEMAYQQAIDLAREQEALSLELRAATSLARLWQRQGQTAQAYELLSAVYAQFTEGFATPDLKAAQALLTDLTP